MASVEALSPVSAGTVESWHAKDVKDIESLLSEKLLEGYTLLDTSCPKCVTPLVKKKAPTMNFSPRSNQPISKDKSITPHISMAYVAVKPQPSSDSMVLSGSFAQEAAPFSPVSGVPFCVFCNAHVVTRDEDMIALERCHSLKEKGKIIVAIDDEDRQDSAVEVRLPERPSSRLASREEIEQENHPALDATDAEAEHFFSEREDASPLIEVNTSLKKPLSPKNTDLSSPTQDAQREEDPTYDYVPEEQRDMPPEDVPSGQMRTKEELDSIVVSDKPLGLPPLSPSLAGAFICGGDEAATQMISAEEPILSLADEEEGIEQELGEHCRKMESLGETAARFVMLPPKPVESDLLDPTEKEELDYKRAKSIPLAPTENDEAEDFFTDEVMQEYSVRRDIATKVLGSKMLHGYSLVETQCLKCGMPLMEYKGQIDCVVCPVLVKKAKKKLKEQEEERILAEQKAKIEAEIAAQKEAEEEAVAIAKAEEEAALAKAKAEEEAAAEAAAKAAAAEEAKRMEAEESAKRAAKEEAAAKAEEEAVAKARDEEEAAKLAGDELELVFAFTNEDGFRMEEEARLAEEESLLEQARLVEEARLAEAVRIAEEEERMALEARLAEAVRIAEEEERMALEALRAAEEEEQLAQQNVEIDTDMDRDLPETEKDTDMDRELPEIEIDSDMDRDLPEEERLAKEGLRQALDALHTAEEEVQPAFKDGEEVSLAESMATLLTIEQEALRAAEEQERLALQALRDAEEEERLALQALRAAEEEELLALKAPRAEEEEQLALEALRAAAEEEELLALTTAKLAEAEEKVRLALEALHAAEEEERLALEALRVEEEKILAEKALEEKKLRETEVMRAEQVRIAHHARFEEEALRAAEEEEELLALKAARAAEAEQKARLALEALCAAEEEERLALEALRAEEEKILAEKTREEKKLSETEGMRAEQARIAHHARLEEEARRAAEIELAEKARIEAEEEMRCRQLEKEAEEEARLIEALEREANEKSKNAEAAWLEAKAALDQVSFARRQILQKTIAEAEVQAIAEVEEIVSSQTDRFKEPPQLPPTNSMIERERWETLRMEGRSVMTRRMLQGWTMLPELCLGKECANTPLLLSKDGRKVQCVVCDGCGNGLDGVYADLGYDSDEDLEEAADDVEEAAEDLEEGASATGDFVDKGNFEGGASLMSEKESIEEPPASPVPTATRSVSELKEDFETKRTFVSKEIARKMMQGWSLLDLSCNECMMPLMHNPEQDEETCVLCGPMPRPLPIFQEPKSRARNDPPLDPPSTEADEEELIEEEKLDSGTLEEEEPRPSEKEEDHQEDPPAAKEDDEELVESNVFEKEEEKLVTSALEEEEPRLSEKEEGPPKDPPAAKEHDEELVESNFLEKEEEKLDIGALEEEGPEKQEESTATLQLLPVKEELKEETLKALLDKPMLIEVDEQPRIFEEECAIASMKEPMLLEAPPISAVSNVDKQPDTIEEQCAIEVEVVTLSFDVDEEEPVSIEEEILTADEVDMQSDGVDEEEPVSGEEEILMDGEVDKQSDDVDEEEPVSGEDEEEPVAGEEEILMDGEVDKQSDDVDEEEPVSGEEEILTTSEVDKQSDLFVKEECDFVLMPIAASFSAPSFDEAPKPVVKEPIVTSMPVVKKPVVTSMSDEVVEVVYAKSPANEAPAPAKKPKAPSFDEAPKPAVKKPIVTKRVVTSISDEVVYAKSPAGEAPAPETKPKAPSFDEAPKPVVKKPIVTSMPVVKKPVVTSMSDEVVYAKSPATGEAPAPAKKPKVKMYAKSPVPKPPTLPHLPRSTMSKASTPPPPPNRMASPKSSSAREVRRSPPKPEGHSKSPPLRSFVPHSPTSSHQVRMSFDQSNDDTISLGGSRMEMVASSALESLLNRIDECKRNLNESSDPDFIMTQLTMIEKLSSAAIAMRRLEEMS